MLVGSNRLFLVTEMTVPVLKRARCVFPVVIIVILLPVYVRLKWGDIRFCGPPDPQTNL